MAKKEIRVLLIDDDEDYFVLTQAFLSGILDSIFTIDWKSNFDDGLAEILNDRHQVYLIDYHLGQASGLALIKEAISRGCRRPIILLTGLGEREIDLAAMESGADDYLEKAEISSRLFERSIRYAIEHKKIVVSLQDALDRIKTLSGLLPICANCKKIRDDKGYWNKLESYIQMHSKAEFSHGICPECLQKLYPEYTPESYMARSDNGSSSGKSSNPAA